jgi:gliding motility-associated-like protein
MKKTLLFLIIFLHAYILSAQGETDYWYFGEKAGLHFGTSAVNSIGDGKISTFEGCSSRSDMEGNLLFYTDGVIVYNKAHEIMENGTGLNGHNSSTQSALILQHPDKPYIYYIFTTDAYNITIESQLTPTPYENKGLNYSVLDLRLNDGLGAITEKNISLLPESNEKLTATYHQNGNDIWVMTHTKTGNSFKAFYFNNDGIITTPITSNIGQNYINRLYGLGYLKFSHKGEKLANINAKMTGSSPYQPNGVVEIMKFDKGTGVLTDIIKNEIIFPDYSRLYGLEFSYNDNKLYVSKTQNGIYQFDLTEHSNSWLNISKIFLSNLSFSATNTYYVNHPSTALQLGKDKKIYIAMINLHLPANPSDIVWEIGEPYDGALNTFSGDLFFYTKLSTIEYPSRDGFNCTPLRESIHLQVVGDPPAINGTYGRMSLESLPNFNQSLFTTRIVAKDICLGNPTQFHIASLDSVEAIHWEFGDGTSANGLTVSHTYPNIGSYNVIAQVTIDGAVTTVNKSTNIYLPPIASPTELIQCDDDIDGFSFFNLTEVNTFIASQDNGEVFRYYETESDAIIGDFETNIDNYTNYQNEVANSDIIYVRVENDRGCYDVTSLTLTVSTSQINDLMLDFYTCDNLESGSNIDGISTFDFSTASINIVNILSGIASDYIISYYYTMDDALSEQNLIDNISNFTNNTSPFTANIFVRIESVNNNNCVGIGHFITLHTTESAPNIQMDDNYFLCENETITLEADAGYDTYLWSTGETTQTIDINHIGLYTITVGRISGNTTCESSKEILVLSSNIAQIEFIESSEWSLLDNNITIHVNGIGDYEYSLDGINYQNSNEFNGLEAKNYTVYVNDKNGCGVAVEDIYLVIYPKFFTPNNDGYNDTWQIFHYIDINFVNLSIFDRYGKLIKKIDPNGIGWDGKLHEKELPSADYWFHLEDENGKIYYGHFTLKR